MEVHSKNYVGGLALLAKTRAPMDVTGDTYITQASYDAALNGCGAAIALVDAVCDASEARGLGAGGVRPVPAPRPPRHAKSRHGLLPLRHRIRSREARAEVTGHVQGYELRL